jgi:hypothetical protein
MMRISKVFVSILAIIILTIAGCKKEQSYTNNALITGYDPSQAPCAGTWLVTLENPPYPPTGNICSAVNSASSLGINGTPDFPIHLKLNWRQDSIVCGYNIIITSYERE